MARDNPPVSPGIEFYGGYPVYSESGIDLTLLREGLKRTIEQRLESNAKWVAFVQAVRPVAKDRTSAPAGSSSNTPMIDAPSILRLLIEGRVEFVVVGGLAMRMLGSAHVTEDLDVCYNRTLNNLAALADALAPIHPSLRGVPPGLPFRLDVPTLQAGLNFTLTTDYGWFDLMGEVSGVGTYAQVVAISQELEAYGLRFRVLSIDGLIASKKAAGRLKDRNHVLELEELKKLREAPPEG
jgi:hypothetical protein